MGQLPPARREGFIVETLGDELLVYDSETSRAHSLNGVAAAVWEASDGDRDAAVIAEHLGLSEDDVWRALTQLDERRLLDGELPHRLSGPEYSRRQAVRRMGLIGASAAFAAPLVKSIIVPTAAQAGASCAGINQPCGTPGPDNTCDPSEFAPCCPGLACGRDEGNQCSCLETA